MAATLTVFTKSGARQEIELQSGVNLIGRSPECNIRISRMLVSRKHCRVIVRDDGLMAQDLGSANGTYVNGQRVMEAVLNAGDALSVGPVQFTVRVDGVPAEVESPGPAPQGGHMDETSSNFGESTETLPTDIAPDFALDDEDDDLLADFDPLGDLKDT